MSRKITRRALLFGGAALAAAPLLEHLGNDVLGLTELDVAVRGLPPAFDGFRVAQLSDLHGKSFGGGQLPLLELIGRARPDLVALTGDMVDAWHRGTSMVLALSQELRKIAPVAVSGGNHEWESRLGPGLWNGMTLRGCKVLLNSSITIERDGQRLRVAGLADYPGYLNRDAACRAQLRDALRAVDPRDCVLLLAHRPQHLPLYSRAGVNLVLSGHVHGGQFRLPGLGGVLSPDRTFFPQYDAGLFTMGDTRLFVHRGLGNSGIPLRVFNGPEVALLTLRRA